MPAESGGHGFAAGTDDEDELIKVIRGDVGRGSGDEAFPHGGQGQGSEEIILKTRAGEVVGKSHPVFKATCAGETASNAAAPGRRSGEL